MTRWVFTGGVSVLQHPLDVCTWKVLAPDKEKMFVLALSCPVTRVTLMLDPAFKGKVVKEATPVKKKLPSASVLVAASLYFCLHRFICRLWKWKLRLKHPGWPISSLRLRANSNLTVLPCWRSFDSLDESLTTQSGRSCVAKSGFYKAPEMMSS